MTDTFSRVCAITALLLLSVIAFNPTRWRGDSQDSSRQSSSKYPFVRNYKVLETEPDAKQINEILTKYGNEGAFELAAAPIIKPGPSEKVLLILVQRW
jgi:hypothetical protein